MGLLYRLLFLSAFALAMLLCGCIDDDSIDAQVTTSDEAARNEPILKASGILWAGFYQTKSNGCTNPQNLESCAMRFHDCLKIVPTSSRYRVEFYSVQANQHICSFDIEMLHDGDALVYIDSTDRKIMLRLEGSKIVLSTNGFNPSPGFCGVHGSFDGLDFPLSSKQLTEGVCFQDADN